MMRPIAALSLLLVACQPPDDLPPPVPVEAPASLRAAHAAYEDGDVARMATHLRETLDTPTASPLVRDNALALLEAGYALGRGTIAADWTLPAGITEMHLVHLRKAEPTSVIFQIALRGTAEQAGAVRQLRLLRGDTVVLDRVAGLGQWAETPEPDGTWFFELEGPELPAPLPEGVHHIELEMADGRVTRGWFILGGLTSARVPRVDSPMPGEVTGQSPRLAFEAFRSPTWRPWEGRGLGAWIVTAPPADPWQPVWSRFTEASALTTLDVPPLDPGDYWLGLNFAERRRFGPLTLMRASRTAVPFSVGR